MTNVKKQGMKRYVGVLDMENKNYLTRRGKYCTNYNNHSTGYNIL